MKLGDMARPGWDEAQLRSEDWIYTEDCTARMLHRCGFRVRSLEASSYIPNWLAGITYCWLSTHTMIMRLKKVAEYVREHGDAALTSAHRLGGTNAVLGVLKELRLV